MAATAQNAPHIAGQSANIGSLAAFGLENSVISVRGLDQGQIMNVHRAGLEHDLLAVARQIIGALALDLDGGELGRHLRDRSPERSRRRRPRSSPLARWAASAGAP